MFVAAWGHLKGSRQGWGGHAVPSDMHPQLDIRANTVERAQDGVSAPL